MSSSRRLVALRRARRSTSDPLPHDPPPPPARRTARDPLSESAATPQHRKHPRPAATARKHFSHRARAHAPPLRDERDEGVYEGEWHDSGFIDIHEDQPGDLDVVDESLSDEENNFPLPFDGPARDDSLEQRIKDWTSLHEQTTHKLTLQNDFQHAIVTLDTAMQRSEESIFASASLSRAPIESQLAKFENTSLDTRQILSSQFDALAPDSTNASVIGHQTLTSMTAATGATNQVLHRQQTIGALLKRLETLSTQVEANRQTTRQALAIIDHEIQRKLEREQARFSKECDTHIREKFLAWARGGASASTSKRTQKDKHVPSGATASAKGKGGTGSAATGTLTSANRGSGKSAGRSGAGGAGVSSEEEADDMAGDGEGGAAGGKGRKKRRKTG